LDEACKEHDIAYSQNKALSERHRADSILIDKAWSRVKAPDSLGEKAAAYFVTNIMQAKKKFGMGLNKKEKKGGKKIMKNKMKKTNISINNPRMAK